MALPQKLRAKASGNSFANQAVALKPVQWHGERRRGPKSRSSWILLAR